MDVTINLKEISLSLNFLKYYDLSISIKGSEEQLSAFYIPKSTIKALHAGNFIGL